ncbi:MAG: hypothetical protein U0704_00145 [Candidatus Eisenbacteria bacterium]
MKARSFLHSFRRGLLAACLGALALACAAAPAHAVKRIYLANDEHTDYFWTADDATYTDVFTSMLDFYMAQAESTVSNPVDSRGRFNADCSLWMWDYERHRSPAQFARLMGHVQQGDISMPLNNAVLCYGGSPAEAVLRSMYYAGRLERRFGVRFPLAVAMENQTLPAGLASLWAGSGAKYSWRGVCGCASRTTWAPRPREIYRYTGPDGDGVVMKWNTQTNGTNGIGGYLEASSLGSIVTYLESTAFTNVWPWDVSAAFGYGGDALATYTTGFLTTSAQKSNAQRRVIVSNEVDFFEDFVASHGASLSSFSGSFGNEWELYQASMGAVTARFRNAIEKLRTAEALATIVATRHPAFLAGREALRDSAFMAAGLYYEHDWTADGPVPRAARAQFQRDQLALMERYVNTLQADALASAGGRRGAARRRRTPTWCSAAVVVAHRCGGHRHVGRRAARGGRGDRHRGALADRVGWRGARAGRRRAVGGLPRVRGAAGGARGVERRGHGDAAHGGQRPLRRDAGQSRPPPSVVDHRDGDHAWPRAASRRRQRRHRHRDAGEHRPSVHHAAGERGERAAAPRAGRRCTRAWIAWTWTTRSRRTSRARRSTSGGSAMASPTVRHEEVGMIANAARAAAGGDYADANARTDYLTFGHFADFSEVGRGIRAVECRAAPFFQLGASTTTTLDANSPQIRAVGMQVDGTTYGIMTRAATRSSATASRSAVTARTTRPPRCAWRSSTRTRLSARASPAARPRCPPTRWRSCGCLRPTCCCGR